MRTLKAWCWAVSYFSLVSVVLIVSAVNCAQHCCHCHCHRGDALLGADDEEAAEAQRKEEERLQDQREKDEFQQRILARDEEKTRKLAERRVDPETLKASRVLAWTSHRKCEIREQP